MLKGSKAGAFSHLEQAMAEMFRELGVPEREWEDKGLDIHNTPARVARMYRDELLSSYKPGSYEKLVRHFTCFDSDGRDAMVLSGPIQFASLCAHHVIPFIGEAFVGYVPSRKVVGASKLTRVVYHYSHMLQIQERMARQIAEFICQHAQARVVVVLLRASHLCMRVRGVKQEGARLITTAVEPLSVISEDRGILDEFYQQLQQLTGITRG